MKRASSPLASAIVLVLMFLLTRICLDTVLSPRNYGHGSLLYPAGVSLATALLYYFLNLKDAPLWRCFSVGVLAAWISASFMLIVDSVVNLDISWFNRSASSRLMMIEAFIFTPFILLTPFIGGVVFTIVRSLERWRAR